MSVSSVGITTGTRFKLSENTVWGTDMWIGSPIFEYDPTSNKMAVGSRYGTTLNGGMEYYGLKDYDAQLEASIEQAKAVGNNSLEETLLALFEQFSATLAVSESEDDEASAVDTFLGVVDWLSGVSGNMIAVACTLLVAYLANKGYRVEFSHRRTRGGTTTTSFTIVPRGRRLLEDGSEVSGESKEATGSGELEAAGSVPKEVQKDWKDGLGAMKKKYPQAKFKDGGIRKK